MCCPGTMCCHRLPLVIFCVRTPLTTNESSGRDILLQNRLFVLQVLSGCLSLGVHWRPARAWCLPARLEGREIRQGKFILKIVTRIILFSKVRAVCMSQMLTWWCIKVSRMSEVSYGQSHVKNDIPEAHGPALSCPFPIFKCKES